MSVGSLVNHEVIADHALLLSEAADVLLDMALSPSNRAQDLEDIESIQAEASSFPATPGLPSTPCSPMWSRSDTGWPSRSIHCPRRWCPSAAR